MSDNELHFCVCNNLLLILPTYPVYHFPRSFEHSLVEELGYDGYARLRRGFDRAFGGRESLPTFSKVVDAGCGTGLVGEQVRMIELTL